MRSRPRRHEEGFFLRVSDIARLGHVSPEAVRSAAKIFGNRIVGNHVWFNRPPGVEFAAEMLAIERAIKARNYRHAQKICSDSPRSSMEGSPA